MPYSKWQSLTVPPLGFTIAFNVAEVCLTEDATPVSTVGGVAAASLNVGRSLRPSRPRSSRDPEVVGGVRAEAGRRARTPPPDCFRTPAARSTARLIRRIPWCHIRSGSR